jgi:hypothetical protein
MDAVALIFSVALFAKDDVQFSSEWLVVGLNVAAITRLDSLSSLPCSALQKSATPDLNVQDGVFVCML